MSGTAETIMIFQQDGQSVRVYVPRSLGAELRTQVCRQVKLHGGRVVSTSLNDSNIVILDLDNPLTSRNTYRSARNREPPLPVVPASWIWDSVQAGCMCDPQLPKYDSLAKLDEYQTQTQQAQAIARRDFEQQEAQARSTALEAQAQAQETRRRTSMNGRAPYDRIDRKHIVAQLASHSEPYNILKIAKELHQRYGRHSVMSYQMRLRDHLYKNDNYAAHVQVYLAEQRRDRAPTAALPQPPQLEFLTSPTGQAEQSEQQASTSARGDNEQADLPPTELFGADKGASPSPPTPVPIAPEQPVSNASAPKPATPTGSSKARFMSLEREALAHRLATLFEEARAKGCVSDVNLLDRDPLAVGAQRNPLLNPPEPLWQELAEQFPSHSATSWRLHHSKNVTAYHKMARLTLKLEAFQMQAAHSTESDVDGDMAGSAEEDAEGDTQRWLTIEPALSDLAGPSSSSSKLAEDVVVAVPVDERTLKATRTDRHENSQFSDADETGRHSRIKRRRFDKDDETTARSHDLHRPDCVDYGPHSTEPQCSAVEQAFTKANQPCRAVKLFEESPAHRLSSAVGDGRLDEAVFLRTTAKHQALPPPQSTPTSARPAAQQERVRKRYLREVVALRDEYGFATVAQMIAFLGNGDLSVVRKSLNRLIEGYQIQHDLKQGDVLDAIRQGGGVLKEAEKIMKAKQ